MGWWLTLFLLCLLLLLPAFPHRWGQQQWVWRCPSCLFTMLSASRALWAALHLVALTHVAVAVIPTGRIDFRSVGGSVYCEPAVRALSFSRGFEEEASQLQVSSHGT